MGDLSGKKILLGVSGSIAAYKSVFLVRSLQKQGAEVRVVMTAKAITFVTPLTFEAITHHPVYWNTSDQQSWNNHIELSLWADAFLIAPATANTIAKIAHGMAEDMLTACHLAARCPVIVAPSMDMDMWHHAATKQNVKTLTEREVKIVPVGDGYLASGLTGEGRMAEPEEIVAYLATYIFKKSYSFSKKHVLITAGPTYESIDPVRYIGNASSGKMGIALADSMADQGAQVTLVLGPSSLMPASPRVEVIRVRSALDMLHATSTHHATADICIFAAAVADYRPVTTAREKIKKTGNELDLKLIKNPDIAYELGKVKKPDQIHVGFALESTSGEAYAKAKLKKKNFDMVVLNSLLDPGAGFGGDTNKTTFFFKNNKSRKFKLKAKSAVAEDILQAILTLLNEKK